MVDHLSVPTSICFIKNTFDVCFFFGVCRRVCVAYGEQTDGNEIIRYRRMLCWFKSLRHKLFSVRVRVTDVEDDDVDGNRSVNSSSWCGLLWRAYHLPSSAEKCIFQCLLAICIYIFDFLYNSCWVSIIVKFITLLYNRPNIDASWPLSSHIFAVNKHSIANS